MGMNVYYVMKMDWVGFTHLIVPEPDPVIENGEQHDVVDERFQSSGGFRYRECLFVSPPYIISIRPPSKLT